MADVRRRDWPEEDRRAVTEEARRGWRFKAARERVQKIIDGEPPLSPEQRETLALLLHPGGTTR